MNIQGDDHLEVVILFSLIYLLSNELHYFYAPGTSDMKSYIDFLFYSLSVSAYNFSFTMDFTSFQKCIHVSQVFVSVTLVVLSFASYMEMGDSMSEMEKKMWQLEKGKKTSNK